MATISRDELRNQLRDALTHGLHGTVAGHAGAIEEAVRADRMKAENAVELLRSARYNWTNVSDDITRHPLGPRYWKLRQDLTRATLRIAQVRRWDASANHALPKPWQCTLGDPEDARCGVISPCHAFTYAKTRRGSGWMLDDATREFRRASTDRFHGPRGGICALLAEEIAEIITLETVDVKHRVFDIPEIMGGQHRVLTASIPQLHKVHALLSTTRDELIRTHVPWMPSFHRYCQWWRKIFEVALYQIDRELRAPKS